MRELLDIYTSDTTIQFDDTQRLDLVFTEGGDDVSIHAEELCRLISTDDGVLLTITSGADHVVLPWKYMGMLVQGIVQMMNDRMPR